MIENAANILKAIQYGLSKQSNSVYLESVNPEGYDPSKTFFCKLESRLNESGVEAKYYLDDSFLIEKSDGSYLEVTTRWMPPSRFGRAKKLDKSNFYLRRVEMEKERCFDPQSISIDAEGKIRACMCFGNWTEPLCIGDANQESISDAIQRMYEDPFKRTIMNHGWGPIVGEIGKLRKEINKRGYTIECEYCETICKDPELMADLRARLS